MPDVEKRCRLVEEQQVGLLGEGQRDPCPLMFPTGEGVHGAVRKVFEAGESDGPLDGFVILATEHPERADVGKTALRYQFSHREIGWHFVKLGKDSHAAGDFPRGEARNVAAVETDRTRQRLDEPSQGLEHGALARSVGTHQRRAASLLDAQIEAPRYHVIAVSSRYVRRRERRMPDGLFIVGHERAFMRLDEERRTHQGSECANRHTTPRRSRNVQQRKPVERERPSQEISGHQNDRADQCRSNHQSTQIRADQCPSQMGPHHAEGRRCPRPPRQRRKPARPQPQGRPRG